MRKSGPSYYRILEEKAQQKRNLNDPIIRFVKFSYIRYLKEFPRYPDHASYTVPLASIGEEAREKSLFLFVSHKWLRPSQEVARDSWDGKPNPDNKRNDVFKLCVKGIEQLLKSMAPKALECYIWIDYCCLDQNERVESEILNLEKVMEFCDAVFTPIHDPDYDQWDYRMSYSEPNFTLYQSKEWLDSSYSLESCFLNRAWCRLEMFFASNAKFKLNYSKRISNFTSELVYYLRKNQRPCFLYGTKEFMEMNPPLTLPPFSNEYFEELNPELGFATNPDDDDFIILLMNQLTPLIEENNRLLAAEKKSSSGRGGDWLGGGAKDDEFDGGNDFKGFHRGNGRDDGEEEDDHHQRSDEFFNKFFERKGGDDEDEGKRSRACSVYSDEFLFEGGGSAREGRELNESMFNRGIYAAPFDD